MPTMNVLALLPTHDFDPTEIAVPWQQLEAAGHVVTVATPNGQVAQVDAIVLTGKRLGIWAPFLRADANGVAAFERFVVSRAYLAPLSYDNVIPEQFGALLLPGGHAPGMRTCLGSRGAQEITASFFDRNAPVGAICHGTVLAARSISKKSGKSVLYGRKTTSLTAMQEMTAYALTRAWLGDYYRTYPISVEAEVTAVLADTRDFTAGPLSLRRDRPDRLDLGFVVRDGNYVSARWPGDAHRFASTFIDILK